MDFYFLTFFFNMTYQAVSSMVFIGTQEAYSACISKGEKVISFGVSKTFAHGHCERKIFKSW